MIQVRDVSKRFGSTKVLHTLSFSLAQGEIVGFVGPNGAGKTTTLQIISGFLRPDSGAIQVAGHDVQEQRKAACSAIGYMPERAPLDADMRVSEFLKYRATLKGVQRSRVAERVEQTIEELELASVARKLISRISKGFRQRVALGDALIANPKVLILDEPTSGLDPMQRRTFRALLKTLSKDRCVLFSSHVLPEVEAVVSRYLVLHKGKLIADGSLAALREQAKLTKSANAEETFARLIETAS